MSEKKTVKLHEIIAAEKVVKGQGTSILTETANTFNKKDGHFDGMSHKYEAKDMEGEIYPDKGKEMVATVTGKLDHTFKHVAKSMLLTMQKEETNSSGRAKAVLVIDGQELGEFSATTLLTMENIFSKVIETLKEIPTLDMTNKWTKDEEGVQRLKTQTKTQMGQTKDWAVIVPPTEHFPAETREVIKTKVVGTWTIDHWSSKMTPAEKSEIIGRADKVYEEVKRARQRANDVEISRVDNPSKIFDYILGK